MDKGKITKEKHRLEAILDKAEVPQNQREVLSSVIDNIPKLPLPVIVSLALIRLPILLKIIKYLNLLSFLNLSCRKHY